MKRWLTTVMAATLCLALLGCAEKDEGAKYIQTTKKAMEEVQSVRIVNAEELKLQVDGQAYAVTSTQDYVAQYEPLAVHLSLIHIYRPRLYLGWRIEPGDGL